MNVLNFISPIDLEKNNRPINTINNINDYAFIGEEEVGDDPGTRTVLFPLQSLYSYQVNNELLMGGFPILIIRVDYDENEDEYTFQNISGFTANDLINFINSGTPVILYTYTKNLNTFLRAIVNTVVTYDEYLALYNMSYSETLAINNNGDIIIRNFTVA